MQKGEHTWERFLHYYSCPHCGYILENRNDYLYKPGNILQKKLMCQRCKQGFVIQKKHKPLLAPLIGKGQPPEVEWNE